MKSVENKQLFKEILVELITTIQKVCNIDNPIEVLAIANCVVSCLKPESLVATKILLKYNRDCVVRCCEARV